jgi:hypothetical protein
MASSFFLNDDTAEREAKGRRDTFQRRANEQWEDVEGGIAIDDLIPDYSMEDPSGVLRELGNAPAMGGAQGEDYYVLEALRGLQGMSAQQGLSAADRAMMDAQQRQISQQARSARDAQMQQAQARGMGSSGLAFMSGQAANEAGADRSADMRAQMMMGAQQRALQAMQAYGSLGTNFYGQSFGQDATRRGAIDDFNRWRAETQLGAQGRNTDRRNQQADARVAGRQRQYDDSYQRYRDSQDYAVGYGDRERDERRYNQDREDRRTQQIMDTGTSIIRASGGGGG